MKVNEAKRNIFNDAVDLLTGAGEVFAAENGIRMLPIDSICPFRPYEGERLMLRAEEIGRLDKPYFNIILAEEYDVTLQLKNTEHIWYIHNPEYPERTVSLGRAVRGIMGHEVFQMNGRK